MRRFGWRLLALSLGQLISWGILYYALIVASPKIAAETPWSLTAITGAFSLGVIVSGVAGIQVGRWLDAIGPRLIMSLGGVVGPAGLLVVSVSPNLIVFTFGWVIVGLAQSVSLYQAAFTVVVHRHGRGSRGPMTVLTIAGGLASTVFAPVVAAMLDVMDWRGMFQVLAAVLFVTIVPLHWFSLERAWTGGSFMPRPTRSLRSVLRQRRFWVLEAAMLMLLFAVFTVTLSLIPLFMEKGMTYHLAAWALGLLGAGQLAGRLLYLLLPKGIPPWLPLSLTAGFAATTLAALAVLPGPEWVLIAFGMLAGALRGAQTLIQATAVVDRWGPESYGSINGFFAAPLTVVMAAAPGLGPLLAGASGSFAAMALIAAAFAATAAVLARWT